MGDVDRRFIAYQAVEFGIDFIFCDRVERGRRLIKHNKRRVFIQRPGKGEFLRLTAGNLHAGFLHILVKIGIKLLFHPADVVRDARFLQTGPDARFLVCIGDGDILRQREGEHAEILKYHGEELPISGIVIFADIDAV